MNQYRRNYKHENKRGNNQTCNPSVTAVWFPLVLFNENSRTESIFTYFSYIFLVLLNESSE